jgi:glycosyltransferase involved in cell wall biosynthesis
MKKLWPEIQQEQWMDGEYEEGVVSVIVPVYNRADLLPTALNSVWRQTYRPIEVIIVDDGSDDDTLAVAELWASEHSSSKAFKVQIIRQPNRGAGAARNHGLIASNGEFIQYLDSDDVLHPEKIEKHVQALRRKNAEYAWSPMVEASQSSVSEDASFFPDKVNWSEVRFSNPDRSHIPESACAGLYSRTLCTSVGPWAEDLVCREDWDYRYRCDCANPSQAYVDKPLYAALIHSEGRINDRFLNNEGIESLIRLISRARRYKDASPSGADISLRGWYLHASMVALQYGTPEQQHRVFELAKSSTEMTDARWKIEVMESVSELCGSRLTYLLCRTYSSLRLMLERSKYI